MQYDEDKMLMLSGIQHYMFCPRQWGLIHLSQEWEDNHLTAEGNILHTNVDNPNYRQKNGDTITLRSVHIASRTLGLYGITDAVELTLAESPQDAIIHPQYEGFWKPMPVEYKRGKKKATKCDEVQLAAQVMCIEEIYGIHIEYGALFYFETRRRDVVHISDDLRNLTRECAERMHEIFDSGIIPTIQHSQSHCNRCSLKDICMPEILGKAKVSSYLKKNLYEEAT